MQKKKGSENKMGKGPQTYPMLQKKITSHASLLCVPFCKNMQVQTGSAEVFALNNGEGAPVCEGKLHSDLDHRLLF